MQTNKRVLIVDDDPAVRETWNLFLEMEGFDRIEAGNGLEALNILKHNPAPDLILLDLMMPIMNGFEFAEAVSKDPELSRIPIIVLSAYIEEAPRVPGAKAVMGKPADLNLLLAKVKELTA